MGRSPLYKRVLCAAWLSHEHLAVCTSLCISLCANGACAVRGTLGRARGYKLPSRAVQPPLPRSLSFAPTSSIPCLVLHWQTGASHSW